MNTLDTLNRKSFSLAEVIIAFGVFVIFLTGASLVFTQGNQLFLRGTWKLQGSKNLQIYLNFLKEDFERASNALRIDDVGGNFQMVGLASGTIFVPPQGYNLGKFPDNLTRGYEMDENNNVFNASFNSNLATTGLANLGDSDLVVPLCYFQIYGTNRVAIGDGGTGNWIGCCLYLKGGSLFYIRTNTPGDAGLAAMNGLSGRISVPGVVAGSFNNPWPGNERFFNQNLALNAQKGLISNVARVAFFHQVENSSVGIRDSIQLFVELRNPLGNNIDRKLRLFEVITGGLKEEVTVSPTL